MPGIECLPAAFHDSADLFQKAHVGKASVPIPKHVASASSNVHGHNLVCIAVQDSIWMVSGNNHLPYSLVTTDLPSHQIVDLVIVEIIFGLNENERLFSLAHVCQPLEQVRPSTGLSGA